MLSAEYPIFTVPEIFIWIEAPVGCHRMNAVWPWRGNLAGRAWLKDYPKVCGSQSAICGK